MKMTGPLSEALAKVLVESDPEPCDPVEYDAARYYRDFAAALAASPAMRDLLAEVRAEVLRHAARGMSGIGAHRDPCRLPDTPCLCGVCDFREEASAWLRARADREQVPAE